MQKNQLVKKTWGIDTDSTRLLESLKVCVCDSRRDHLSVNWIETQHYPKKLCELILQGFKAELTSPEWHFFAEVRKTRLRILDQACDKRQLDVSLIPS